MKLIDIGDHIIAAEAITAISKVTENNFGLFEITVSTINDEYEVASNDCDALSALYDLIVKTLEEL